VPSLFAEDARLLPHAHLSSPDYCRTSRGWDGLPLKLCPSTPLFYGVYGVYFLPLISPLLWCRPPTTLPKPLPFLPTRNSSQLPSLFSYPDLLRTFFYECFFLVRPGTPFTPGFPSPDSPVMVGSSRCSKTPLRGFLQNGSPIFPRNRDIPFYKLNDFWSLAILFRFFFFMSLA